MPKVSVCVPVYGVEKYIERCARSLFEQTLDDMEFIFVDDCTPDRSIDILKSIIEEYRFRFAEKKYTARIERMPTNSGQAAVRRHGIQLATGDYITFCDSDDIMPSDAVETLYNLAIESGADIVSGDMEWLYDDGTTKRSRISLPYGSDSEAVYRALLSKEYSHTLWSKLFKNSLLQEHEYITLMNHTNGEDGMLFYQVLQYAQKVVHQNKVVYSYYQNSHSSTHLRIKDHALSLLVEFYNYVVNIPYQNSDLKHLAICYATDCINEFALNQGLDRMKKYVNEKGVYPYLSFSFRLKYMTIKQNLIWYAKYILSHIQ
ncbi:MAG: glycosyltransferase family 2 protein [Candidatus Aphodosoma sp.]